MKDRNRDRRGSDSRSPKERKSGGGERMALEPILELEGELQQNEPVRTERGEHRTERGALDELGGP